MTLEEFRRRSLAAQRSVDDLLATYSVGDYVWAAVPGGSRPQIARIHDAHPIRTPGSRVLWLVHVRTAKRWWGPVARRVAGALSPHQVAHNRKLGLIPAHGESL